MKPFIVMCRVSGGVTGTRQAPLKVNGAVQRFETYQEAALVADNLLEETNGNPYRVANFEYWPAEA